MFNVAERYVVSLQVKRRFSHRNSSFLLLTLQRYKKIPRYASLSVIIFQIFFCLRRYTNAHALGSAACHQRDARMNTNFS